MKTVRVVYFQRKPIPGFHFSVEIIFKDVRQYLPAGFQTKTRIAPYFSKGIIPRLFMMVQAVFQQGDINHITGDISFIGILLNKEKTVQTILDCVFLRQKTGLARSVLKYFWLDLPVKRCHKVTTISHQTRNEILALTNCKPEKVQVIPIALSNIFIARPARAISEVPKILLIGNAPNKNWKLVLDALRGISCEVHVVAQQDKAYREKLLQTGLSFHYHSGLSQIQMLEKYLAMDLLVFASTYEGFGMPIIEAQAVGVPVITSKISSMPEVAGAGAHLVDPYNMEDIRAGVLKVLEDDDYRNRIVELGKKNTERFKPEHIALQYAGLYLSIIQKSKLL